VLGETREQRIRAAASEASRLQPVPAGERLAVALHLVGAVELRAQRRLRGGLRPAQRRHGFGGVFISVGSDLSISSRNFVRLTSSSAPVAPRKPMLPTLSAANAFAAV